MDVRDPNVYARKYSYKLPYIFDFRIADKIPRSRVRKSEQ